MRIGLLKTAMLLIVLGLISTSLCAADVVSEEGIPYKAMIKTKVHLGEMVKKGQPLFTIELSPLEIQKKVDEKNVIYTKDQFKRDVFLHKHHAIKFKDYLSAKAAYQKALTALTEDEIKIDEGTDKAPFDGEVTKINSYTGSAIGDGADEMDVTKTSKPIPITEPVVAQVMNRWEEPIIMDVKVGQKVKKGQLLFSTSLKNLKAELARDKQKLKLCDQYLEKIKGNYQTHSISEERYEAARKLYADTMGAVETDLDKMKESNCYAPFDGVVTSIHSYTGSTRGAATDIVDITKTPAKTEKKK